MVKNCVELAPKIYGLFEVFDRIGPLVYRITLLTNIKYHNIFHISLLKRYVHDTNHIIDCNVIQVEHKGYF